MVSSDKPRALLPPEWAPQGGVMLTWPHHHSDWQPWLGQVEPVFEAIAREIAARERLLIVCYDEDHRQEVSRRLSLAGVDLGKTALYAVASNDTWARDHGPVTVLRDGRPVLLDFTFNGWGRKHPHDLDNAISGELHRLGAFNATPMESERLVLEGGGIETDGAGTLLTTTRCQLSPQRNPEFDCVGLEGIFSQLFGVERVLWLEHGHLAGDDTDSHIDTLARFCDPHTIAHVSCDDAGDEHSGSLNAMAEELRAFRDVDGRPYRLVPLPLPRPHYDEDGLRLPATYANFLIINGAVLVPLYEDPADAIALERLGTCFPGREIIGIDCRPLIQQYGSLHCLTMQFPAGVL